MKKAKGLTAKGQWLRACDQRMADAAGEHWTRQLESIAFYILHFAFCISSNLPPSLHRLAHRDLVGVFEIAADRDAHRDAGHTDAERLQQAGQVDRRGLSLDVRVGGQDHFFDLPLPHALEEPADLEVVGT